MSTTQVLVNAVPHPAISSSVNTPVCTNTNVVYSTEAGKTNYQWILDGIEGTDYQVISGGTNNTVTVNWLTSGTKQVSVIYQNPEGCSGTPASVTTTIHAASASITNNTGTALLDCNHPAISLTAAGGVSYVWNNGLGNTASVNITSPGVYSVLVTDANGCSATAQISITQNLTTPGATIINQTGSTQLNCNTTSIHLTATGNGSYSWDGGLGNQADVYLTTP
ncbi:MAG: hypothetical protein IPP73_01470 [Chitinophagaceae bacterium]|nr:hypothetical protein [Chitinophagaceae bacterium]